ncbi:MAG TPA: class I SAM-dependent methyltransferase, partial [Steroidobacteraceae bacterium]|nr:class I SAM-dependent methyltransferase [Steroidobacteraceae bacterium]
MSDSNKTSPDGTNDSYALGRSEREYARLARQAELLRPTTQRLFVDAGIGPGMRVLDVGSGAGDVSFLLAKLVGPSGEVLGVDLDAEAVRHSRERAAAAGLGNVRFQQADLSQTAPAGPFDAIVGRLALMYLADPGAGLGRLVRNLRPGGIVAFMEPFFQIPPG